MQKISGCQFNDEANGPFHTVSTVMTLNQLLVVNGNIGISFQTWSYNRYNSFKTSKGTKGTHTFSQRKKTETQCHEEPAHDVAAPGRQSFVPKKSTWKANVVPSNIEEIQTCKRAIKPWNFALSACITAVPVLLQPCLS